MVGLSGKRNALYRANEVYAERNILQRIGGLVFVNHYRLRDATSEQLVAHRVRDRLAKLKELGSYLSSQDDAAIVSVEDGLSQPVPICLNGAEDEEAIRWLRIVGDKDGVGNGFDFSRLEVRSFGNTRDVQCCFIFRE